MRAFPQQAWVNLEDERGGLCLMNRGLTEYEVSEDESRTIGMCLLRTAPMKICTEFRTPTYDPDQEGGQCLGHHVAEYFIYPHTGGMANGRIATVADQYNTPLRVLQTAPHVGSVPANGSLLEMDQSPIRLTAIKRAEVDAGSWIIRLNNPGQESAKARLTFAQELIDVWRVNLMEDAIEQVPVETPHELRVLLTRGKIASYKLTFKTDEPGL
jgi:alpha-mannosidase